MPFRLSPQEIFLIFFLIILFFGTGRISKIAGEMGKGIRSFRANLKSAQDGKGAEKGSQSKA